MTSETQNQPASQNFSPSPDATKREMSIDISGQGPQLNKLEGTYEGGVEASFFLGTDIDITITKPNNKGVALQATSCPNITKLKGTFPGKVIARYWQKLTDTEELVVTGTDKQKWSAVFTGCDHLKKAAGKYAGFASWAFCPIEEVGDLSVSYPDDHGDYVGIENKKLQRKATQQIIKQNGPQQEFPI